MTDEENFANTESWAAGPIGPGSELGAYLLRSRIGGGSSGSVYEAIHRVLGTRVAIKVLAREHCAREERVRRFMREARAAAKLDHPHVVRVLDVGSATDGTPYLVMEFLQGETLSEQLKRVQRLTINEAADIFVPVLSAVAAAHDAGIVHRDLSPMNIFLSRNAQGTVPKVLDFGVSKFDDLSKTDPTVTDGLFGTPYYSAPEQAQHGARVDARADQFALGAVLYQCVTGKRPFNGESLLALLTAVVRAEHVPPRQHVSGIPAEFEATIERALLRDPAQRFPSARGFGRALLPFASPRVHTLFAHEFAAQTVFAAASVAPPSPARTLWWGAAALALIGMSTVSYRSASESEDAQDTVRPSGIVAQPLQTTSAPLSPPRGQSAYRVDVRVEPSDAELKVDGETAGRGHFEAAFVLDGTTHVLEASAPGYQTVSIPFRDAPLTRTITLEKHPLAE